MAQRDDNGGNEGDEAPPVLDAPAATGNRATDVDFSDEDDDDRGAADVMGAGSHKNLPNEAYVEATQDSVNLASPTDATPTASRTPAAGE